MSFASATIIEPETIRTALEWTEAVGALSEFLLHGPDPAGAPARTIVELAHGQLLVMPAENAETVGVKVASVSPGNPSVGLPRIQALYLLLDGRTHRPTAILDGTALTNLRTPAVSGVAIENLAVPDATDLVVFGTGPQAQGHIEVASALRPIQCVTIVGRDPGRAAKLVAWAAGRGLESRAVAAGPEANQIVAGADIIVCATTSTKPLFDGRRLTPDTCVIAIGSHEPDRREVDGEVVRRAVASGGVVVETRAVALREAGDIVMGIQEHACTEDDLVPLRDLVRRTTRPDGVTLFKSCGMGWEDLVIAEAIQARTGERS